MGLWPFKKKQVSVGPSGPAIDEFIGQGPERSAQPFDPRRVSKDWQHKLSQNSLKGQKPNFALPAFSLLRGGDLFESNRKPAPTPEALLKRYVQDRLHFEKHGASKQQRDFAEQNLLRVIAGNPALCLRMLAAKPIKVILAPDGADFRQLGFPRNTNPRAAGLFWNHAPDKAALLGLKQALILEKPWLMVHEMSHAVHLMGFSQSERELLDSFLRPVYLSKTGVEEAFAVYAEKCFGAEYEAGELNMPNIYGKLRREWNPRHVFSLFVQKLFLPGQGN